VLPNVGVANKDARPAERGGRLARVDAAELHDALELPRALAREYAAARARRAAPRKLEKELPAARDALGRKVAHFLARHLHLPAHLRDVSN